MVERGKVDTSNTYIYIWPFIFCLALVQAIKSLFRFGI
jgi:hypothetical protein